MSSDLLQEYVVRLRYAEDTASRSSMLSGLGSTVGTMAKIATGGLAVAAGIVKSQHSIASGINSLYLSAHNMGGSTIRTLQSITSAAKDVGDSVEGMTSSLAGLNKFSKTMGPGAQRFIQSFAGKEYKPGMSAPDTMLALAKNVPTLKAQGMTPEYLYAAMDTMGIGFESAQAIMENNTEFLKQQAAHKEAGGSKIDELAPTLHADMERFDLGVDKLYNGMAKSFGETFTNSIDAELKGFESVVKSLDENSEGISTALNLFTGEMGDLLKPLTGNMNLVGTAIAGLATVMAISTATGVAGGVIGLAKALPAIGPVIATGVAVYEAGKAADKKWGITNWLSDVAMEQFHPDAFEDVNVGVHPMLAAQKKASAVAIGKEEGIRLSQGILTLKNAGMSQNEAIGAMANLSGESNLNPFAEGDKEEGIYTAYGIGQWHKDRRANYTKLFGHSMQSVGDRDVAYAEQLQFVDWERKHDSFEKSQWAKVHAAGDTPYEKAAAYSTYMERPGAVAKAADVRGKLAEQIASTNNNNVVINVNGMNKDPEVFAKEVDHHLNQINKYHQRYNESLHQ